METNRGYFLLPSNQALGMTVGYTDWGVVFVNDYCHLLSACLQSQNDTEWMEILLLSQTSIDTTYPGRKWRNMELGQANRHKKKAAKSQANQIRARICSIRPR